MENVYINSTALSDTDRIERHPCIRNCCLNDKDVCLGCFRSLEEIKEWGEADNHARNIIRQKSKQRKEAYYSNVGRKQPFSFAIFLPERGRSRNVSQLKLKL